MAISPSEILPSSTTFVLTVSSFPAYVTTAEIPNETVLFTLSRELVPEQMVCKTRTGKQRR